MLLILIIAGFVLYFVLRGKSDPAPVAGAPKRAMGQGPVEAVKFVCPYPKCGTCGAPGEGMKQEWDGMRAVKWTCGSCGTIAGVQELRDEELPVSARRRLGLDQPQMQPGFQQPYQGQQGGGVGNLLTGMMIGSMMGGGDHHHHHESGDWNSGSSNDGGFSDGGNESWGDSGGSSDSGGDWGDSGGSDSSGGDW